MINHGTVNHDPSNLQVVISVVSCQGTDLGQKWTSGDRADWQVTSCNFRSQPGGEVLEDPIWERTAVPWALLKKLSPDGQLDGVFGAVDCLKTKAKNHWVWDGFMISLMGRSSFSFRITSFEVSPKRRNSACHLGPIGEDQQHKAFNGNVVLSSRSGPCGQVDLASGRRALWSKFTSGAHHHLHHLQRPDDFSVGNWTLLWSMQP